MVVRNDRPLRVVAALGPVADQVNPTLFAFPAVGNAAASTAVLSVRL